MKVLLTPTSKMLGLNRWKATVSKGAEAVPQDVRFLAQIRRRYEPSMRPHHVGTVDEFRQLSLDELLAQPELLAWYFPADRYEPSGATSEFEATAFKRLPVSRLYPHLHGFNDTASSVPEVAAKLLPLYDHVLGELGLSADHHGWVFIQSMAKTRDWLLQRDARHEQLVCRVLRCLALLALTGFSRSDYKDLDGFSYAVGLYRKLEELKQLDKSVQYVAFVERCHKAIEV
jgi:hypothetical protein